MVPMLQCGLVRSNLLFAIALISVVRNHLVTRPLITSSAMLVGAGLYL